MFITTPPTLPPKNYYQCIVPVVVNQTRGYLVDSNASETVAKQEVFVECQNLNQFSNQNVQTLNNCNTGIFCAFNSAVPRIPTCTVVDGIGGQFTAQAPFTLGFSTACNYAMSQCTQAHNLKLQFLLPCRIANVA